MPHKKIKTTKLVPLAPFDFNSTFHKPDHFESGDGFWLPNIRWQTCFWQGKQLGLKFTNKGTINQPRIRFDIYAKEKLEHQFVNSLIKEMRYRFNLDLDLKEFYQKFKNDKILGPIIKKWKGMRPGHPNSLYEYLIIGIVLQNATVKRSIQMYQRLLEKYGTLLEFDKKKLWVFWKPGRLDKVEEEELRALKVGYRAKSIKKIDEYFKKGLINEFELRQQERETQERELLKLYGVGPATVWYLLFDVFHHFDFFNHISPWEQKIYSKLFFKRNPENPVSVDKLLKYFERYGDYRQIAVHYIWEDLWWKRENQSIDWLEKLVRG